jgi:hypothetical protein
LKGLPLIAQVSVFNSVFNFVCEAIKVKQCDLTEEQKTSNVKNISLYIGDLEECEKIKTKVESLNKKDFHDKIIVKIPFIRLMPKKIKENLQKFQEAKESQIYQRFISLLLSIGIIMDILIVEVEQ